MGHTTEGAADLLADLEARGLVHDTTDRAELAAALAAGPITLYHGIDPSADSLHIGNFVGVLMLRRFQDAGHRVVVLVGGSTGMVGDPGGRSEERNLLDEQALATNVAGIRGQLERLVDFDRADGAELVNNYDWTRNVGVLEFLRDVGKHATVNQMVARDSVKSRMASEHGISYTEFSYMLLQAFDYWWLHENKGVTLQIGGSDQWGNIAQGVDLIRRRSRSAVHALTWPLITRADGQKFGKSVDGAVWLDPERTLPYEFHQYWLNTADADVERFLLQLTLVPLDRVREVMATHAEAPEQRQAQRVLADEVTALVHGPEEVTRANLARAVLFGGETPTGESLDALRGIVPETTVTADAVQGDLLELLVATGLAKSKGDARRSLADNAYAVNGVKLDGRDQLVADDVIEGRVLLLQKGKKTRHLVHVDPS
ncbi:MAG: tyrosine--tRNA ligase [Acidimicrobiales bacterium]|nr:tyrosine--tRNA ligase [Acidimicrobiales bacterium]